MAYYVARWLNEDVRLSRHISRVEADLCDGLLVAELFARNGHLDTRAVQSMNAGARGPQMPVDERLENFDTILRCADARIGLSRTLLGEMALETPGSAAELLLRYKYFLEGGPAEKGDDESDFAHARAPFAPAAERRKKIEYLARRPVKEADEAHEAHEAHEAEDRSRWPETASALRASEMRRLQYELLVKQREEIRRNNARVAATVDGRNGVDWFERNLRRLGVGGDAAEALEGDELRMRERPEDYEARLQRTAAQSLEKMSLKSGAMLAQLQNRARARSRAREEKERRNRRALVDQAQAGDDLEDTAEKDAALEEMVKEAKARRAKGLAAWRMRRLRARAEEESRVRSRAAAREFERAFGEAFDETARAARARQASEKSVLEHEKRRRTIASAEERRARERRGRAEVCARSAVDSLLELVARIASIRAANGADALCPSHYGDLLQRFVSEADLTESPAARSGAPPPSRGAGEGSQSERARARDSAGPAGAAPLHLGAPQGAMPVATPRTAGEATLPGDGVPKKADDVLRECSCCVALAELEAGQGSWVEAWRAGAPSSGGLDWLGRHGAQRGFDAAGAVVEALERLCEFDAGLSAAGPPPHFPFVLGASQLRADLARAPGFRALALVRGQGGVDDAEALDAAGRAIAPIAEHCGVHIVSGAEAIAEALRLCDAEAGDQANGDGGSASAGAVEQGGEVAARERLREVGAAIRRMREGRRDDGAAQPVPAALRFEALRALALWRCPPVGAADDVAQRQDLDVTSSQPAADKAVLFLDEHGACALEAGEEGDGEEGGILPRLLQAWLGGGTDEAARRVLNAIPALLTGDRKGQSRRKKEAIKKDTKQKATADDAAEPAPPATSALEIILGLSVSKCEPGNSSEKAHGAADPGISPPPADEDVDEDARAQPFAAAVAHCRTLRGHVWCGEFPAVSAAVPQARVLEDLSLILQSAARRRAARSAFEAERSKLEVAAAAALQALAAEEAAKGSTSDTAGGADAAPGGNGLESSAARAAEVAAAASAELRAHAALPSPWSLRVEPDASLRASRRRALGAAGEVWCSILCGEASFDGVAWREALSEHRDAMTSSARRVATCIEWLFHCSAGGSVDERLRDMRFRFALRLRAPDARWTAACSGATRVLKELKGRHDELLTMARSALRSVQLRAMAAKPSASELLERASLAVNETEEQLGDLAELRNAELRRVANDVERAAVAMCDEARAGLCAAFTQACAGLVAKHAAGEALLQKAPTVLHGEGGDAPPADAVRALGAAALSTFFAGHAVPPAQDDGAAAKASAALQAILLAGRRPASRAWSTFCAGQVLHLAKGVATADGHLARAASTIGATLALSAAKRLDCELEAVAACASGLRSTGAALVDLEFPPDGIDERPLLAAPSAAVLEADGATPSAPALAALARRLRKAAGGRPTLPAGEVAAILRSDKLTALPSVWREAGYAERMVASLGAAHIAWRTLLLAMLYAALPGPPSDTELAELARSAGAAVAESHLEGGGGAAPEASAPPRVSKGRLLGDVSFWFEDVPAWEARGRAPAAPEMRTLKDAFAEGWRDESGSVDLARLIIDLSALPEAAERRPTFCRGAGRALLGLSILFRTRDLVARERAQPPHWPDGFEARNAPETPGIEACDAGAPRGEATFAVPVAAQRQMDRVLRGVLIGDDAALECSAAELAFTDAYAGWVASGRFALPTMLAGGP